MIPRPCITCGKLTRATRCPACQRAHDTARRPPAHHRYGPGWATTSRQIIQRDQGVCWICGQPGADTADHIVPRSQGGTHDHSNLRAAHRACNSRRGARTAA